jgi:hypothetical protein
MSGYVHTGVGNATVRTNYASAGQVQDGALEYLGSVSGTDTITASAAVGMTAYTVGQTFRFVAAGANTTTAVTININGIGAKNITKNGTTALAVGDIPSGAALQIVYDGTQFQVTGIVGVVSFSAGSTGLTPSTATNGVVTLAGTLKEANGGTGTTTGYYGFKNRIINGGMKIDQRNTGAAQTVTAAAALAYTVDRWYAYSTGANVTGQRVAGTSGNQNNYQFTGAASVTAIGFGQRIESFNAYDLASQTATLSVSLANSLLTSVTWTAYYANTTDAFGTLASPTRTSIATGTFTVSSTLTQYTANISMPANAINGVEIVFTVGAQTSGTWTIGSVQLEKGSTATSFDYRPYGTELQLCQRYYEVNTIQVPAGTAIFYPHFYKVSMRVAPTIAGGGGGFATVSPTTESVNYAQTATATQTLTFSAEL